MSRGSRQHGGRWGGGLVLCVVAPLCVWTTLLILRSHPSPQVTEDLTTWVYHHLPINRCARGRPYTAILIGKYQYPYWGGGLITLYYSNLPQGFECSDKTTYLLMPYGKVLSTSQTCITARLIPMYIIPIMNCHWVQILYLFLSRTCHVPYIPEKSPHIFHPDPILKLGCGGLSRCTHWQSMI